VNAIPIHLYVKGLSEDACLEAARYAAENTISAVWIDVSDSRSLDLCETVASETPLSVIASVHGPSLIGDALDAEVSGIAVHPSTGPALVDHKETLLKNRTDIFLLMDDSTPDSYTGNLSSHFLAAGSKQVYFPSGDGGSSNAVDVVPEAFFNSLNEITGAARMLEKEGFDSVYVHIHHPNPVLLFNVNRFVKNRLKTKHVVSMTSDALRERSLIQNSLSLSSLFHEGIGDVLLIPHGCDAGHGDGRRSEDTYSDDAISSIGQGRKKYYKGVESSDKYDDAEKGRISSVKSGSTKSSDEKSIIRRSLESLQESILFAIKILGSCKLFPKGYTIISCPTCGRCRLDLLHITKEIDNKMKMLEEQFNRKGKKLEDIGGISVAVMGCNVNGPGEARNADIGIAGRNNKTGVLFKNGKPFKSLPEKRLVNELIKHTRAIIEHKFETV